MTAELRDWFVRFYCQLSRFDEPVAEEQPKSHSTATPTFPRNGMKTECRRLCAYNFPVSKKHILHKEHFRIIMYSGDRDIIVYKYMLCVNISVPYFQSINYTFYQQMCLIFSTCDFYCRCEKKGH